jgi:hypothetical protein
LCGKFYDRPAWDTAFSTWKEATVVTCRTIKLGLMLAALAIAATTSADAAAKKAAPAKAAPAKAATTAQPTGGGGGVIDVLKGLLGIDDLEDAVADLQDDNDSQQSQINALLAAVGSLNATVGEHTDQIAALQECCDDLQNRVERLEALADCQDTVCLVDDVNYCIDTDTNRDHCGGCNDPCAANEDCVEGACELKPCDPIDQCHDATLMMDGTCVQTNKPNTTECDDGLGCTVEDLCQSGMCVGFGTPCDVGVCFEDGEGGFFCE